MIPWHVGFPEQPLMSGVYVANHSDPERFSVRLVGGAASFVYDARRNRGLGYLRGEEDDPFKQLCNEVVPAQLANVAEYLQALPFPNCLEATRGITSMLRHVPARFFREQGGAPLTFPTLAGQVSNVYFGQIENLKQAVEYTAKGRAQLVVLRDAHPAELQSLLESYNAFISTGNEALNTLTQLVAAMSELGQQIYGNDTHPSFVGSVPEVNPSVDSGTAVQDVLGSQSRLAFCRLQGALSDITEQLRAG